MLDKQILKLRAGEKLSNQELSNITNTMETVSTWLTSQMTGNDKTRALGPARDECLYILEKAKKRLFSVFRLGSKKNFTKHRQLQKYYRQ